MDDDLFSYHARRDDPDTSHEAVPKNIPKQARRVLEAYVMVDCPILDHTAYVLVGLPQAGWAHQRCSDLRRWEFIERCGRGVTPSGKSGYLCRITPRGRAYLERPSPELPLLEGATAEEEDEEE